VVTVVACVAITAPACASDSVRSASPRPALPECVGTTSSNDAGAAGGGIQDSSGPLGSRAKKYTLQQARASIAPNRLVLPRTSLTSDDAIQGIWATGGKDAETWIQYKPGIVITEAVPTWDLPTALPRASNAVTDVASLGKAILGDGSGASGGVTQIGGQDAFAACATDPSHTDGPGNVVVEVAGSEDSVVGTTSEVTMNDLYNITSALIEAGKSPSGAA